MIKVLCIAFIILISIYSVNAQDIFSSFSNNLKSDAITNSIGEMSKNSFFLWYTTVGGELNPQYETQRMFLDFFLYMIFFLIIVRTGIKSAFGDRIEKRNREILSAIISLVLTISLIVSGNSIGKIVPFVGNIGMIAVIGIMTFFMTRIKNKEGKQLIGTIPAILISLIACLLLFNGMNLLQGKNMQLFSNRFDTERTSDFSARVIAGASGGGNPATNYQLALAAVQQYDYEKAQDYFLKVIDAGYANNPYYMKTAQWITIKGGDKLFKHMVQHYPSIMAAERSAAEVLLDKAEKEKDMNTKIELAGKAEWYINDTIKKAAILTEEINKPGRKSTT